jgi:hypothetical protein
VLQLHGLVVLVYLKISPRKVADVLLSLANHRVELDEIDAFVLVVGGLGAAQSRPRDHALAGERDGEQL